MRLPVAVLSTRERKIFEKLSSPHRIQDFINALPINFEEKGETCMSPRRVLREKKAHCIEGAFLAAAALWFHEEKPLLLDLRSATRDLDHVVALFKAGGRWGAISKTNHAVLRYREPVYQNVRELALSYFHEYFTDDGKKTLRSFSRPFDLSRFAARNWITDEKDLWWLSDALDASPHEKILSHRALSSLRLADKIEREAGKITEWKKKE